MGSLHAHGDKLKTRREKEPLEQALYTKLSFKEREKSFLHGKEQGQGRGYRGRGGFQGRGREIKEAFNKEDESRKGSERGFVPQRGYKSQVQCYSCQKYGHYASECKNSKRVEEKANLVDLEDDVELTVLMTNIEVLEEKSTKCHQDSAASNPMTSEEHLFMEIEKCKGNVTFGDESWAHVQGEHYVQEPSQRRIKVEFEEELCDWSINKKKRYDLFHMLDDEEEEDDDDEEETIDSVELAQQHPSPSKSQGPSSSNERDLKTRSLHELYEVNDEKSVICELMAFEEAVQSTQWRQAMDEEIKLIDKSNTWELTSLPRGQKVIEVEWLYKGKETAKREAEKYKTRPVAKGYKQRHNTSHKEDKQTKVEIFICQAGYMKDILETLTWRTTNLLASSSNAE